MPHPEHHKVHRTGWLRAAVLGANDGIVSTASLIIGVAAADAGQDSVMLAGVAGLVAGAMSMAAGEFVSVSSQADTEKADLEIEKRALERDYDAEKLELAQIYIGRGLEPVLADQVAEQLMAHDPLEAHARDEIGISSQLGARPVQAAASSGASFSVGAALPLLVAFLVPGAAQMAAVATASLAFLTILGSLAAKAGGAPLLGGAVRVAFWGSLAMVVTAIVGRLFEVVT